MIRLILMRHARADESFWGKDALKPLSIRGQEEHEKISKYLVHQNIQVDAIFYSPLLRAKQTASIVSQSFPQAKLQEEKALGIAFDSNTILQSVLKSQAQVVILVGHEPTLVLLASQLMKAYKPFTFERSGSLVLDFEEELHFGNGKFKFYFSPKDIL
ncbi:MAG: Phosphohistidine phosphatase SixA [Chlamydiae bacterium]|nr:Phosphohistidine phosphatase SixA [Chlamydiota bacterium]